jgi:DNA repair protein RecO (recombination protein O)
MRVSLQPAFVLHTKYFRDTSLLIYLFTLEYGRVTVVARGARSAKSKSRGLLLPFVPLLVSWSGKTDLMSLSKVETNGLPYNLYGTNLLSGFYLHELLVKLLALHDPYPNVFRTYQATLKQLQDGKNIQAALRLFEKNLINNIGYGLELIKDAHGQAINADNYYCYEYERGFVKSIKNEDTAFSGKSLLALHNNNFADPAILNELKNLMRLILNYLLVDKPIKSRELLI